MSAPLSLWSRAGRASSPPDVCVGVHMPYKKFPLQLSENSRYAYSLNVQPLISTARSLLLPYQLLLRSCQEVFKPA